MRTGQAQFASAGSTAGIAGVQPAKKTVLSDRYALGEELGRGAYGNVFKGTDLVTNESVAIKQISLAGMSQSNLQAVMGEIELLKTLNHPNIVKYIGSFKSKTHLYIILEYMDDGALSAMIKPNRIGVLSETLASVYISQVLNGLAYLHEQGVVHRDIKGANILIKEGLVKLADFGVAAKLGELEDRRDELQQHVVGTPYWMAPEVIQMTQVTQSADIWSVGCLIVELLTGSPPYYDLQQMSALFRIVQDESPPLPDRISPLLTDFLQSCFHKDPKKRPGALELLKHAWITRNTKTMKLSWRQNHGTLPGKAGRSVQDHESVTSVVSRMVALSEDIMDQPATAQSLQGTLAEGLQVGDASPLRASVTPLQDAAVTATPITPIAPPPTQQPTPLQASTAPPQGPLATAALTPSTATSVNQPQKAVQATPGTPTSATDWSFTPASAGYAPQSPAPLGGGDLSMVAAQAVDPADGPVAALASLMWGPQQDGAGQLDIWLQNADRLMPIMGSRTRQAHANTMDKNSNGAVDGFGVEYRDGYEDGMGGPVANTALIQVRQQVRELVLALRPSQLSKTSDRYQSSGIDAQGGNASMNPAAACTALAKLIMTSPDAKQMVMTETGSLVVLELLDTENPKYVELALELLLALTHEDVLTLQTICLLGMLPAAARYVLPQYPASLRLRAAMFLARFFSSGPTSLAHFVSCQGLKYIVAMFADPPTPKASQTPATGQRLGNTYSWYDASQQPQATTTESKTPASTESVGLSLTQIAIKCIFHFLDVYNILPHNYLCRLLAQNGIVPRLYIVLRETITQQNRPPVKSSPPSNTTDGPAWRAAGVAFHIHEKAQASGQGINKNSMTVPNRGAVNAATLPAKWGTSAGVLAPQMSAHGGSTSSSGAAVQPGSTGSTEEGLPALTTSPLSHQEIEHLQEQVVSLLLLLSNGDPLVKGYVCQRDNLTAHLNCMTQLPTRNLMRMMRALRWLTCEHSMLPSIKEAGAIPVLVPCLAKEAHFVQDVPQGVHAQLEALHAVYNICRFSKSYLEAAANVDIIRHLCFHAVEGIKAIARRQRAAAGITHSTSSTQNGAVTPGPGSALQVAPDQAGFGEDLQDALVKWERMRFFVVSLLVALVRTSSTTRAKLWASSGPDVFLSMLIDQECVSLGVFEALDTWLSEDHVRMEPKLTQKDCVNQVVQLFNRLALSTDRSGLEHMLDVLRKMIGRSSTLAVALAVGPQGIVPSLLRMIDDAASIMRVKILEILRCLYEHYPRPKEFLLLHKIPEVLRRLLETGGRGADAVHQEAQRLLTAFQINVLF